jgi:membrane protein implicated in regulation of membrane protease activity
LSPGWKDCVAVTTPTRYFLLQIPGWGVVAILLAALHHWFGIPLWIAWGGWVIYVIKDFVLYPYLRPAYETQSPSGAERLTGQMAIVTQALEPKGYVQLAGDLWQARAAGPQEVVAVGSRVRVKGAEGLVLLVVPESPETPPHHND